jgi:aminoglycoside phosphotransferase (APT) family kinase protein
VVAVGTRQHDLDAVRAGLERWLRSNRSDDGLTVAPLTRPSVGLSSETLFVDVSSAGGDDALVARLPPAGDGLFPAYDLAGQAETQRRLAATEIPVADPIAFEPDPEWVGVPFLVMPRIPGRALTTQPSFARKGWLHDARTEEQTRLQAHFIATLAAINRLDWRALELGFLARDGDGGIAGELGWWAHYVDWASDGAPLPVLTEALAWCRDRTPDPEPAPSLLWGDVQFVNAVYDDEMRPAAILDWEMASIGPAEIDLGWHLVLHQMTAETAGGDLSGFVDRGATIRLYETRLGRPVVDLDWFETFALLRSGAILARIAALLSASGVDDSWLTEGNPQIDQLARRLRA